MGWQCLLHCSLTATLQGFTTCMAFLFGYPDLGLTTTEKYAQSESISEHRHHDPQAHWDVLQWGVSVIL